MDTKDHSEEFIIRDVKIVANADERNGWIILNIA